MAKGKSQKSEVQKTTQKTRSAMNKINTAKKREKRKEYWATNKEYIAEQNAKGYEKQDGKWMKVREVHDDNK